MSYEFHTELSEDYLSVLKSGKYSDVIIKVGEGSDSKEYKTHSFVLMIRSEFFKEEIRNNSSNSSKFSIIHQTCSKYKSFKELQTYCDTTAQLNPGIIFKADDFITLDKDLLIFILENRKLKLYEIQKWDYIVKWGIAQTPSLPSSATY